MSKLGIEKIAAGIAVLAVVVAGTWAIATRSIDSEKEAMGDQIKQLQDQVKDLQNSEPSGAVAKPLTSDAQETQSERSTYSLVFTAPENGATVSQFVEVQYSQVGNVPSGMHTILVVQDPLEQFWSWGSVYPNLSKRIQVGIPKDIGVTFHIGLLVTDREFPINQSRRELPEHIHYQSIKVHRR